MNKYAILKETDNSVINIIYAKPGLDNNTTIDITDNPSQASIGSWYSGSVFYVPVFYTVDADEIYNPIEQTCDLIMSSSHSPEQGFTCSFSRPVQPFNSSSVIFENGYLEVSSFNFNDTNDKIYFNVVTGSNYDNRAEDYEVIKIIDSVVEPSLNNKTWDTSYISEKIQLLD